jgi:hypothetical protein
MSLKRRNIAFAQSKDIALPWLGFMRADEWPERQQAPSPLISALNLPWLSFDVETKA